MAEEKMRVISIHAPRGGSDFDFVRLFGYSHSISIHAPRGGSDKGGETHNRRNNYFNPRSPWGERQSNFRLMSFLLYFNPRSPWGERPVSMPLPI